MIGNANGKKYTMIVLRKTRDMERMDLDLNFMLTIQQKDY